MEIIIGGFIFWLAVIGIIVALEVCTVYESHWGFAWLVGFLVILAWISTFNPFAWMWNNPARFTALLGLYCIVGFFWGFGKWWFHAKNEKDDIDAHLAQYQHDYAGSNIKVQGGSFTDYLEYTRRISLAKNNKTLISVWMTWWPFSMFWTFFDDVVRRCYNWLIEQFIGWFDKINAYVFGSLNNK